MKKLLLFLFCLASILLHAKTTDYNFDLTIKLNNEIENSNFKLKHDLTEVETNRLYLIGKVWGLFKYYHPEISEDSSNWDNELFKNLNLIYSPNFENDLFAWLNNFSSNLKVQSNSKNQDFVETLDLKWISKNFKNKELVKLLQNVSNSKNSNAQYTIEKTNDSGLIFKNENTYSNMQFDDDGIKLLALFRYWNAVEYWYAYKSLIAKDWDDILISYIPKITKTKNKLEFSKCINEFVVKIEDTHAVLTENSELANYFGKNKLPISAKLIKDKLVVTDNFSNSNFKKGDIILQIDNKPVETLVNDIKKYCTASNEQATLRNIASKIIRTNNENSNVLIEREKEKTTIQSKNIDAYNTIQKNTKSYEIDKNVGYINAENASKNEIEDLFTKWNKKNSIIIDLRGYPKENLSFVVAPFLHKSNFVGYQKSSASLNNPGYFIKEKEDKIIPKSPTFKGYLYVLVDEYSQSKAEFNTLVLQAYNRTVVVGSQTAGTDGSASKLILPSDLSVYITTDGLYYPNWRSAQKTGIIPQIGVENDIKDYKKGIDAILEKAIDIAD